MTGYDEEIFGPVLVIVRTDSHPEAIGNGVAIFTNDGGPRAPSSGTSPPAMVGLNVPIPVPVAYHSFGGWKASLFGDLHIHGPEGVHFYTLGKVITRRWADPSHRGVNRGFPVSG